MNNNLEFRNSAHHRLLIAGIVLSLIFSAFLPIFSAAAETEDSIQKVQTKNNFYNIVILGDSLAVGYEYGFTAESKAYGVGEHLFEQAMFQGLRASYSNYGIIGLTSTGLSRWLEAAVQNKAITVEQMQTGLKDWRAAELLENTSSMKQSLMDADLIMLTIGGNDFLKILSQLNLEKKWADWTQTERDELQANILTAAEQYETQLKHILSIIYELNPNAKVVTQNQFLPLPKFQDNYVGIELELANTLVAAQSELNKRFDEILQSFTEQNMNIKAVDAAAVIDNNARNLTAIILKDPHPNALGYKRLAQQYSQLIWGEFRQVQEREEDIPLSVVVNGKEVISPYPTKLIEGRTFLVLRDITDAMGATTTWDNKSKTASITLEDREVEFTVGATTYKVNGKTYNLNAEPAFLEKVNNENKTYIPVAALSEGLDFFVQYQAKSKIVFINK